MIASPDMRSLCWRIWVARGAEPVPAASTKITNCIKNRLEGTVK
jgi:hypothetical protein